MESYPAGTPIEEVHSFDRGQKVAFKCIDHPQWVYVSKDPYVSNWFPGDKATQDAEFKGEVTCRHKLTPGQYVVAHDYHPTRDG